MSGVLNVDTIADNAGTGPVTLTKQSATKVWINFKPDTPSIRDSFNVASVTDHGVCNYTDNFTNNMANGDYAVSGYVKDGSTQSHVRALCGIDSDTYSTSAFEYRVAASNATNFNASFDAGLTTNQINGDLA